MSLQILQTLGSTLNTLNPGVFDTYEVNGIKLADGRVITLDDQKEKKYIGISDNVGTSFYIRVDPNVVSLSSGRKVSSLQMPNLKLKSCRLVAFSFKGDQNSETLLAKLETDLSRIQFTGINPRPIITIKKSNSHYIDNFIEECNKQFTSGDSFVCVSIDFDLRYSGDECEACVPVNFDSAYVLIIDEEGNVIDRRTPPNTYSVLVFSGIDGGTPSTIYSNSIVGGTP